MSVEEIAWAAGLFEGEGSISLRRRCMGGRLKLSMCDRDVILRFKEVVSSGKVYGPYKQKQRTPIMFSWVTNRWDEIVQIFEWFSPYLGVRRLKKFQELIVNRPRRTTIEYGGLPTDCGYCKPGEVTNRGYNMHRKTDTLLCKGCYRAGLNYWRERRNRKSDSTGSV